MSICAHLREPVTVLSSLPVREGPGLDSVLLPRDDEGDTFSDSTANGALHWVPLQNNGLRDRMALITEWVARHRPSVLVVDVSVEVTLLARLLGVPVVVVALPGDRSDAPHELAHRAAQHILAAWPQRLYEPRWLQRHARKTTYVGGISRFDGRRVGDGRPPGDCPGVLVLNGSGGAELDIDDVSCCAAAHPEYSWSTLGVAGGPWVDDPWPALCAADVVVSSAGQGCIADIAAAGRPAIVIAADRPFTEQGDTATALHRAGLAVVRSRWPDPADWPRLIDEAGSLGTDVWNRWETRGAAARAARLIERVSVGSDASVAS